MGNFPRSDSSNWVESGVILSEEERWGRNPRKKDNEEKGRERHKMRRRWSGTSQIRWTSEVALVIYVVLVSYRGGDSRDFPQSLVIARAPIRQVVPSISPPTVLGQEKVACLVYFDYYDYCWPARLLLPSTTLPPPIAPPSPTWCRASSGYIDFGTDRMPVAI